MADPDLDPLIADTLPDAEAILVDGAGEFGANGIYMRSAEPHHGCPQWELTGTRWRIYWPCAGGACGWVIGEATEPVRTPHYVCEVSEALGRRRGLWRSRGEMEAWCLREGNSTELFATRWHCYRTGLLPPMFEGGLDPPPDLAALAPRKPPARRDPALEQAEAMASAELRQEALLSNGPPWDVLLPAVAVLAFCALATAAHFASIAWEAMGLTGNARIEL